MGHLSTSSPATRSRGRLVRVGAVGVLSLGVVVAWTLMMNLAGDTLSFEPTQESVAARAAARPVGVAWALLEVAAVVALAVVARRTWLTWLTAPGLVVAATLLLSARSNGGAFLLGLAASVLGVAGAAITVVMRARSRARQLRGPFVASEPEPPWPGLPDQGLGP